MIENSNNHEVKDKSYVRRNGFGLANYCKQCHAIIPKSKRFCLRREFEKKEKATIKRKAEKEKLLKEY